MMGAPGGQEDQVAQGDPGAPHSQCQEAPEVQVGPAGPGCSLPLDPESQGSLVGQGDLGVQAHLS